MQQGGHEMSASRIVQEARPPQPGGQPEPDVSPGLEGPEVQPEPESGGPPQPEQQGAPYVEPERTAAPGREEPFRPPSGR